MNDEKNQNNFCIAPFVATHVYPNGDMSPCCKLKPIFSDFKGTKNYNIKESSIEKYWESDYLLYLQNGFLNNQKLPECIKCWHDEDKKLTSLRMNHNRQHKVVWKKNHRKFLSLLKKEDLKYPVDFTIHIGNYCNLKCQMCNGKYSSKLLIENKILNFENLDQKDYDWNKDVENDFINFFNNKNIENINIIGGEPFLNPTVLELLKVISKSPIRDKTLIQITTNGTIFSKEIEKVLRELGKVRIIFSIDSTQKCNDYVRYPSKWQDIDRNINNFKKIKHLDLMVHSVVQNLTLSNLHDIINYCENHNFYHKLNILHTPSYLKFNVLPKKLLEKAFEKLSGKTPKNKENYQSLLDLLQFYIENYELDRLDYSNFLDMVEKRDNYRKISIKNFIPQLAEEILK